MALNDVSLTCVPASKANSAETTGLRVDGRDAALQPVPAGRLKSTKGRIRFKGTPRHPASVLTSFAEGTDVYLCEAIGDVNNRIELYATAANNLRLRMTSGGVATVGNWNCIGALAAAVTYGWEIRYNGTSAVLMVNGVVVITVTPAAGNNLQPEPVTVYWGSDSNGHNQADLTFATP